MRFRSVDRSDFLGAPSTTRTCDLLDRNQTLYPTELWARFKSGAEAYRIDDGSEYLADQAVCCELVSAAEIPDLQGKYREMRETSLQDGTRFSVSARSRGLARHVP